ncbi:hypothetical protein TMatcc_006948 [Talaromyces marneffei ATCC 18224]|uniref:Uncharacterized protein n=1 Tax=Talaromyces marneffei (strain ATCC 18224 / CBS 334.59 / QM 7333) TaxID=441960 RepID=B6QE04_TALMQ|nr:uncharacterized protein EYB26_003947 [Talaromyces marneffei]EEA23875.1 conserved hypothetical protein [Talaromyces marneffei ATCC 18224]QGA16280.1 hypothetical protein EYB26_003947 [Talaromyces marneffei]
MVIEDSIHSAGNALPAQSLRLQVYVAWVDVWVSSSKTQTASSSRAEDAVSLRPEDVFAHQLEDSADLELEDPIEIPSLSTNEMADYFQEENLPYLLNQDIIKTVIHAFRQQLLHRRIKVGGALPPSCPETDVFSEKYDPRVECKCEGDTRANKETMTDLSLWQDSEKSEYKSQGIFTNQGLIDAVIELFLSSSNLQQVPDTCQGSGTTHPIPEVKAPDRRPSLTGDSDLNVHDSLFPTTEKIKLFTDAKYFLAMACGGSLVDEGVLRAIADAGNDVLIGDYCDAVDEETITILQKNGAAAVAFLKLCTLADIVTSVQFDNLVASLIQFRVLGYYRDHGRTNLASGFYGSDINRLPGHRYIDLGIWVGMMSASLATGKAITEEKHLRLATVCTLLNDLVDLRSDTMRKQRENPILRGVRGCLCNYLDSCISRCLTLACEVLESDRLSGMVVLGFCNWTVMASHHKVYELVNGVQEVKHYPTCTYALTEEETNYSNLLKALEPYGTLEKDGPHVYMKRATMDQLYAINRSKPDTHFAWMADITRSLLRPQTLRKIVDVVHFEWSGDVGDREFCP